MVERSGPTGPTALTHPCAPAGRERRESAPTPLTSTPHPPSLGPRSCCLYESSNNILPTKAGESLVTLRLPLQFQVIPGFSALLPISAVFCVGGRVSVRPRPGGGGSEHRRDGKKRRESRMGVQSEDGRGRSDACSASLNGCSRAVAPRDDRGEAVAIRVKGRTGRRFLKATCRRQTAGSMEVGWGVHGSRQRRRARVTGAARQFDGDQSPAEKR